MTSPIRDYALIGDTQTGALVSRQGSIDWLCLPRFDSGACFAALLGDESHGRWLIAPHEIERIERRYLPDTLVLETTFHTREGSVQLLDFMPVRATHPRVIRIVKGLSGSVTMRMELVMRFDYGSIVPWVRRGEQSLRAIGGPDALHLTYGAEITAKDLTHVADFRVASGDEVEFVLSWHESHREPPARIDARAALADTEGWWREWASSCTYEGPYRQQVVRSLMTLKALTFGPTGGIVAALTTSLPERPGGVRNWDYRYCWLRDATLTLYSLMRCGFREEAIAWRDWLLRAVAGQPQALQTMYGLAGERRLAETTLDWLPGYAGSQPVRIGNAAALQFQLDVYGGVLDALHLGRRVGLPHSEDAWQVQTKLAEFVEEAWRRADQGIWEVRGARRHFTHSKVMAWVAMDRVVKAVERFGYWGPVERWRRVRDEIHDDVCRNGYDPDLGTFTQYYGSASTDAALLMIPVVGFLPWSDSRVKGTIAAVERDLLQHGFVRRYLQADDSVDGLPPGEGTFLPCTFWLADCYCLEGRTEEATHVFERLLACGNDLGLFSEEFDPETGDLLGNFPQAFSHVALVNTAHNLARETTRAQRGPG
jgi:GH15 family glucan-1,4-alpha-glucosidase